MFTSTIIWSSFSDGTTDLTAEAQVERSAKGNWLTKNGTQNVDNNRLLGSGSAGQPQNSLTIKNAVIEDTINYNQQTFLYDETGKVLVDVYKAVKDGDQWIKGEKVIFNNQDESKCNNEWY